MPLGKQSFTAKELADGESLGGCSHLKHDSSSALKTRYRRSMASRYEIQFSDAARADFDRLQSQAESSPDALRQLLEVHALLDQIAEGEPAEDSLVPGTLPEPGSALPVRRRRVYVFPASRRDADCHGHVLLRFAA